MPAHCQTDVDNDNGSSVGIRSAPPASSSASDPSMYRTPSVAFVNWLLEPQKPSDFSLHTLTTTTLPPLHNIHAQFSCRKTSSHRFNAQNHHMSIPLRYPQCWLGPKDRLHVRLFSVWTSPPDCLNVYPFPSSWAWFTRYSGDEEGIKALDMEAIRKKTFNLEDVTTWPSVRFERAYRALTSVLYKPTSSSKPLLQPSSTAHTPPNQTTIPANPNGSKDYIHWNLLE